MRKLRLDVLLCERGLFATRSRAAAAVMAGDVLLGNERLRAEKAGQSIAEDAVITLAARDRYVSRGGRKLAAALATFSFEVAGRRALDIGASTGGFTDCLLQHGAEHVIALDVGYGELDWKLRGDDRVTVIERTNARRLKPELLPYRPDLIVIDVAFISLNKVLPAARAVAADRHDVLAMVKPQFEVGRDLVGSGGVVRDPQLRRAAVANVAAAARAAGASVLGAASSQLPGPKGNRETFLWLAEAGRGQRLTDALLAQRLEQIDPSEQR